MTVHRWGGLPDARCLDCGTADPNEDECPEPGSKRHDPYNAVLAGAPVRVAEVEDVEPFETIKGGRSNAV